MKKHGASHAISLLACTVSSALLADIIKDHVPYIYNAVQRLALLVVTYFEINHPPEYVTIIIYATILSGLWGVGFALAHSD